MNRLGKRAVAFILIIIIFIIVILSYQKNSKDTDVLKQQLSKEQVTTQETVIDVNENEQVIEAEQEKFIENTNCLDYENQDAYYDAIEAKGDEINEYLKSSENSDTQIMAAIIGLTDLEIDQNSDEKEIKASTHKQVENLSNAFGDYPNNKLVAYHFLGACVSAPYNKLCSQNVIDNVTEIHGSNGAVWSNIAIINAARNKEKQTLEALEQVYNAPYFDDYRTLRLRTFIDTILQVGVAQDQATVLAMGYEAAIAYNGVSLLATFCKDFDGSRMDIAKACIQYGNRLYESGSSYVYKSIGLLFQKNVYKLLNDRQLVEKIAEKKENLRALMKQNIISDPSIYNNKEFIDYWVITIQNYDEISSEQLLKKEAERIMSDPSYVQCLTK